MTIYSGFSHEKLWFSIAMLVYQRVPYVPLFANPWLQKPRKPSCQMTWNGCWRNMLILSQEHVIPFHVVLTWLPPNPKSPMESPMIKSLYCKKNMWKTHISRLHHGYHGISPFTMGPLPAAHLWSPARSPWLKKSWSHQYQMQLIHGKFDQRILTDSKLLDYIDYIKDMIGSWKWIRNWFWLILFTPSNQLQHSKRFWPIMKFCADGYMWHSPQLEAEKISIKRLKRCSDDNLALGQVQNLTILLETGHAHLLNSTELVNCWAWQVSLFGALEIFWTSEVSLGDSIIIYIYMYISLIVGVSDIYQALRVLLGFL